MKLVNRVPFESEPTVESQINGQRLLEYCWYHSYQRFRHINEADGLFYIVLTICPVSTWFHANKYLPWGSTVVLATGLPTGFDKELRANSFFWGDANSWLYQSLFNHCSKESTRAILKAKEVSITCWKLFAKKTEGITINPALLWLGRTALS